MTTVAEVMTKNVASVRSNVSLADAAKQMWDCDCGAIPVLDERGERVIGMITDRDICMATFLRNSAPGSIIVAEAMSRVLHSCSPNDSIATVEQLMQREQIRRVPVVQGGKLAGIISLADIVRRTQGSSKQRPSDIAPDDVTATLAEICQPPARERARARA